MPAPSPLVSKSGHIARFRSQGLAHGAVGGESHAEIAASRSATYTGHSSERIAALGQVHGSHWLPTKTEVHSAGARQARE